MQDVLGRWFTKEMFPARLVRFIDNTESREIEHGEGSFMSHGLENIRDWLTS